MKAGTLHLCCMHLLIASLPAGPYVCCKDAEFKEHESMKATTLVFVEDVGAEEQERIRSM